MSASRVLFNTVCGIMCFSTSNFTLFAQNVLLIRTSISSEMSTVFSPYSTTDANAIEHPNTVDESYF